MSKRKETKRPRSGHLVSPGARHPGDVGFARTEAERRRIRIESAVAKQTKQIKHKKGEIKMANEKKLVEQITSMEDDFAKWYTDVVKKAELMGYSSVKGCMIFKPAGYAI